jgi:hypothetical protein
MPNAWITHVKDFSKRTGKTYGCSISDPECKASYVKASRPPRKAKASKNPKSPKKRKVTKKQAKEEEEFFKKFIDM